MPVEAEVRLVYSILFRTLFREFGLLTLFVSEYERRAGTSFRAAVLRKRLGIQVSQQIIHACKLGTATLEARVGAQHERHPGKPGSIHAEVSAR